MIVESKCLSETGGKDFFAFIRATAHLSRSNDSGVAFNSWQTFFRFLHGEAILCRAAENLLQRTSGQ